MRYYHFHGGKQAFCLYYEGMPFVCDSGCCNYDYREFDFSNKLNFLVFILYRKSSGLTCNPTQYRKIYHMLKTGDFFLQKKLRNGNYSVHLQNDVE